MWGFIVCVEVKCMTILTQRTYSDKWKLYSCNRLTLHVKWQNINSNCMCDKLRIPYFKYLGQPPIGG